MFWYLIFRLHCYTGSGVVCLLCWSWLWAMQKMLNWSRSGLGANFCEPRQPCIKWGCTLVLRLQPQLNANLQLGASACKNGSLMSVWFDKFLRVIFVSWLWILHLIVAGNACIDWSIQSACSCWNYAAGERCIYAWFSMGGPLPC